MRMPRRRPPRLPEAIYGHFRLGRNRIIHRPSYILEWGGSLPGDTQTKDSASPFESIRRILDKIHRPAEGVR